MSCRLCLAQNRNSHFSFYCFAAQCHECGANVQTQDLEHVRHSIAAEKQSNAELAEAVRRQRRAAAKQEAEAAGKEHKHQDEVQELRKVCLPQP